MRRDQRAACILELQGILHEPGLSIATYAKLRRVLGYLVIEHERQDLKRMRARRLPTCLHCGKLHLKGRACPEVAHVQAYIADQQEGA